MTSINSHWKPCQLGDVAKVISGFAFKSSEFTDSGVPVIKISNVRDRSVDLSDAAFVNDSYLSIDQRYHVSYGDILISLTGSHLSQPNSVVGRVARFTSRGFPCLLNQRAGKIIVQDDSRCDTSFLYFLLCTPEKRHEIALKAHGAANQANVSPSQVESIEIQLPSIFTQRKIAGVLSAYDDLIENNTRRIVILEEMAQALYREWFVNFRFPGHEKVALFNSPLGKIPEGWTPQTIGSTLDFHIGGGWGQDAANDEFPNPAFVIRGTDIPEARSLRVVSCPLRFHTDSNIRTRKLRANDLVFEVSGGSKGQPVGRCLFVSERLLKRFDGDVICASFCKLIRANPAFLAPEILYHFLVESYTNGTIEQYEVQSTGIKNFKFTVFLESESLAVPPAKVQQEFLENVRPILDAIHVLGKKNEVLRNTRDLLLPKLISGQLDVEELNIETGEPLVEAEA